MRYAISDIHGCNRTFRRLLQTIQFSTNDQLFLLGDYIDRAPDSKGVIDTIFELRDCGHTVHCLRGNHEQMMLDALDQGDQEHRQWLRNGGLQTLQSFQGNISDRHLQWLDKLPLYFELKDYWLVHAGFDFTKPLRDANAMLWSRRWYPAIDYEWLGTRTILHGHTPIIRPMMEQQLESIAQNQYLDIDGGCVFGRRKYGYLCAFHLDTKRLTFQRTLEVLEDRRLN